MKDWRQFLVTLRGQLVLVGLLIAGSALLAVAIPILRPQFERRLGSAVRLAFAASSAAGKAKQVWVRRLDATLLAGTDGVDTLFWSPDSPRT